MPSPSDTQRAADLPATDTAGGLTGDEPLQPHTLVRYAWLGKLQREVVPRLDPSDDRIKLTYLALYSTYPDLQALGLTSEARLPAASAHVGRAWTRRGRLI